MPHWWRALGRINSSSAETRAIARGTSAAFWAWIGYQTIKGILTTTLIWIPLAYYYFCA